MTDVQEPPFDFVPRQPRRPAAPTSRTADNRSASWLVSLIGHGLLFIAFALYGGSVPGRGSAGPSVFETTLLGDGARTGAASFELGEAGGAGTDIVANQTEQETPQPETAPVEPAVEPPTQLAAASSQSLQPTQPAYSDNVGRNAFGGAGSGDGSGSGNGGRGGNQGGGGGGGVSLFGLRSEGLKIVYLLDRSGSTAGSRNSPLTAAKEEVLASLAELPEGHFFQILVYNETCAALPLGRGPTRLAPATAANKQLAEKFLQGTIAAGGTEHEQAIHSALGLRPDVLFLVTDAALPELSRKQLEHIANVNRQRTKINVVEFGYGPTLDDDNFLHRLARQNGGGHRYVDVLDRGALARSRNRTE